MPILSVSDHTFLSLNSLLFVVLVAAVSAMAHLLKKYRVHYLPESAAAMLLGFIVGAIVTVSKQESSALLFDPEIFYFILLPPIIFEAGYSLQRRTFFDNFSAIFLYAVVGTLINSFVFGYLIFAFAKMGWVPLDSENPIVCLMYGALISSVDPIATLSILGSEDVRAHPTLRTLVFGESVLNDAVAIVLYRSLGDMAEKEFTNSLAWEAVGVFVADSLGSLGIGLTVGLFAAFVHHRVDLSYRPEAELTLVVCVAYASYSLAELVHMSGIMSMFVCGVVTAHYTYFSLSRGSQLGLGKLFKCLAMFSESFLFVYMGITCSLSLKAQFGLHWNFGLILTSLLACAIARAANIFPLTYIANFFRNSEACPPVPFRMQGLMWFSGIRGAVAFALALNFPRLGDRNDASYVITSTLAVTVVTTLVCGGLTEVLVRKLELNDPSPRGANRSSESDSDSDEDDDLPQLEESLLGQRPRRPEPGPFIRFWMRLDNRWMKSIFGGKLRRPRRPHGAPVALKPLRTPTSDEWTRDSELGSHLGSQLTSESFLRSEELEDVSVLQPGADLLRKKDTPSPAVVEVHLADNDIFGDR